MTANALSDDNLYNINHWGEGYFQVNPKGKIEISKKPGQKGVELDSIVNAADRAGLHLPLLVRCSDILHDRIARIYGAFEQAIADNDYQGQYQLVYPIKVNQEQCVTRELLNAPSHQIGLEAGSKPELMAVIGMLGDRHSTIVCNGYKDSAYIRIALIAQRMGHQVYIVIEKQSELDIILKEASRLQIRPRLGVRIRLASKSAGKWENSGGAKSKFGLNAKQVLELVEKLKAHQALDCLQFMHCHLGSQIANIHDIRYCMQEVARYYVELRHLQAPIATIDVGGGLSVDYEGTRSHTGCSMNYNLNEYANHILRTLKPLCAEAKVPEPNIISESGRALTAHHAVLIANVTDYEIADQVSSLPPISQDSSPVIKDIYQTYQAISDSSASEIFNYAAHALHEAHSLFKHGLISLEDKAVVEAFHTHICLSIKDRLDLRQPSELALHQQISEALAAKLFCNISIFQSLPDAWAIGQIFPVAPISQLDQPATMHAILQDLTCDSDGTIKQYPGRDSVNSTLLLPQFSEQNPYHIGFFLVGAYQEVLGNLHNLFGDTNSLDVKLTEQGGFELHDLVNGDTVTNVLNYVHYDSKKLVQSYEKQLIDAELPRQEVAAYLNELRSIFSQMTYLDGQLSQ